MFQRAMADICPFFPKMALKTPGKIIHEYITSTKRMATNSIDHEFWES